MTFGAIDKEGGNGVKCAQGTPLVNNYWYVRIPSGGEIVF